MKTKGVALFQVAVGFIVLFVGVALMYMLPELIMAQLNNTTVFASGTIATAQSKIDSVRGIGFVCIIISVIWILIASVGGVAKQ